MPPAPGRWTGTLTWRTILRRGHCLPQGVDMLACCPESVQSGRVAVARSDGALLSYDLNTSKPASQVPPLPSALFPSSSSCVGLPCASDAAPSGSPVWAVVFSGAGRADLLDSAALCLLRKFRTTRSLEPLL